ncbi:hypothetical protein SK128_013447, partial [Halocaridina rubra]
QYTQCLRVSWQSMDKFKEWLKPVQSDKTKAYCNYYKSTLNAKLCDLRKHVTSGRHRQSSNIAGNPHQARIEFKPKVNDATRFAEGKVSLNIAAHSSLASVDHAAETSKSAFTDSKVASDLKLYRTKCREVIVNVLAPHFVDTLSEDRDAKCSILIDESTDISISKLLGVIICFFSRSMLKIVSCHTGLVEIESGTAEAITCAIIQLLNDEKFNPKNFVKVGVDNDSVNTGVNKGV